MRKGLFSAAVAAVVKNCSVYMCAEKKGLIVGYDF
jgi:hypothetical protein